MASYLDKYIFPYLDYMEDNQTLHEMCVLNESEKESSLERLCGNIYENKVRQCTEHFINAKTLSLIFVSIRSRLNIVKIRTFLRVFL